MLGLRYLEKSTFFLSSFDILLFPTFFLMCEQFISTTTISISSLNVLIYFSSLVADNRIKNQQFFLAGISMVLVSEKWY